MASVNEQDPAGDYNFVIRQGDTFSRGVALSNNGVAVNLTGSTAVLTVAAQAGGSALLTASATGGAAGTMLLTADSTATAALQPGMYVYDFTLHQPSAVTTLLAGQFQVLGQV